MKNWMIAALLTTGLCLSGCGNDEGSPRGGDAASESPTPTPTPTPEPSRDPRMAVNEDPVDNKMLRGSNAAETAAEIEVTEVWYAFWAELVRMDTTAEMDADRLADLASGQAYDDPAAYVARMKRDRTHNAGGAIIAASSVEVTGNKAVVTSCIRTTLIELDEANIPVEEPTVWLESEETLQKGSDGWRVVRHHIESTNKACEFLDPDLR